MAKRIVQMHDKHKSTTNLYPKVTMGSLSPQVKAYIESQGEQEETKGNITAKIYIDKFGDYGLASVLETKKDNTHKAECRVYGNKYNDEDLYGAELLYQEGNDLFGLSVNKNGVLLSGNNRDINITTTGTGKLYINGVEYTGGGKQLYQHNIYVRDNLFQFNIKIITDSDTAFTSQTLLQWFKTKGFNLNTKPMECSGYYKNGSDAGTIYGIFEQDTASDALGYNFVYYNGSTFNSLEYSWAYSHISDFYDNIIAL